MEPFSRDQLLARLPEWQADVYSSTGEHLHGYLRHYGLLSLAQRYRYKIGRASIDDVPICIQRFKQPGNSLGMAVVLHGYMDHMGLYGHLLEHLLAQQLDVVIYDLAGHGLSEGHPLVIDDFRHYASQLQGVLGVVDPDVSQPLILIGQSTGGGIIVAHHLLYADEITHAIDHRILLAPLVRPALWRSIRRQFLMLKHFRKQVPRRYTANSHDASFLRFMRQQDPLQHGDIPLQWISAMLEWGDWVESAEPLDGAITCIQGMADSTVDWHHNLCVLTQVYPQMKVELVEGARHHLVNESLDFRQPVFDRISSVLAEILEPEGVSDSNMG